jgi:hypothetical protein
VSLEYLGYLGCTSNTQSLVPIPFPFARLNALQPAVKHSHIGRRKDVTYGRMCINYHPEKADPNCTCLTVGSNCITYPRDCGNPTADMVTVKIHLNNVLSTKGARYCTIALKDFYLNTLMVHPEFMHMKLAELPEDFARIYKLHNLVDANGFVSIRI